jgi:hypothetical protein
VFDVLALHARDLRRKPYWRRTTTLTPAARREVAAALAPRSKPPLARDHPVEPVRPTAE